ncbi:hypothetical protein Q8A67_015984 [Cirrhinus molitorella]|uniref:Ig-like domain-containing protein n=1 Tax=Cirrhinus molitorella TaxID=172907 RepID=A0AA88PM38_9TELE|nr:hypothetical protein Q8A67_015984 [Cirrhinus molitorella]
MILSVFAETTSIPVSGKKGGNATLPCKFEASNISGVDLQRLSKDIPVSEISVKTGEELKLAVLLTNADKVETNSSGEWREVWNRTDGVLDHHLTDTDGNLTIKEFTANDTGTYRALDSEGEMSITVTVTDAPVQGSSDLLRVQMGESVSLSCSMTNRYEIAWYHLRSEQLELLISADKDETGRKLLINYNTNSIRLKLTADTWVTRATLVISGVTESDSGLYFCGTKSDAPEMFFDKHIRLEIEDDISVKIGEQLKLDVLLSNADKVEHQRNSSTEWKEVWKRGYGVQNGQLNDRDGNLIIKNFTANDAGAYRVLDSEGDILITVTVVESPRPPTWNKFKSDAKQLRSSDLLRVQKGESISLNCSMTNRYEIAWYLLRSEQQLDLLISAEKDKTGRRLLINYNPYVTRVKITADTWVTRATIVISGATESDVGLYFCGTKSDAPEMFFDKPIKLEIEDEISAKIGEELKLDVLLPDADKVQHQSRRSTGWKEDWSRTDGVQSERMTIRDGNLIVNEFTPRDAGSYRVLDPDGEPLITVKVRGEKSLV